MAGRKGLSVATLTAILIISVAVFGWGVMASLYATQVEGYRAKYRSGTGRGSAGLGHIFANAIVELPNAPAVVSHTFHEHLWLPITIAVAEAGVVGLGLVMKKVERSLASTER